MAKHIGMFIHCRKCYDELPAGISPADFQLIEVGWTPVGLQVWCRRHDINILHVDFEGLKHRADTTTVGDFGEGEGK